MPNKNRNLTRDHMPVDTLFHCAYCGHHHCQVCGRCHRPGCTCTAYRPDPRERYEARLARQNRGILP
jgi:hypothetical protein